TAVALPSEATAAAAAWKLTGGAEPDADDVVLRRRAEGYDALAADADAALLLGGGSNSAEGMGTAVAGASRKGALYGDAQAEMRRLLIEQASEAVDLDKLALLGPKGAAAAGIRSPGAADTVAVHVAERDADGRPSRVSEPLDPDKGPGSDDEEECDVAEELLPAAVREQIRLRRQVLRRQRRAAPPPSSLAMEPADGPVAAASGPTSRREALLQQLLGHRAAAEAGSGGGAVSVRNRRTAHSNADTVGDVASAAGGVASRDLGGNTAPLPLGASSGPAAPAVMRGDGGGDGDGGEGTEATDGRDIAVLANNDDIPAPDSKAATAADDVACVAPDGGGGGGFRKAGSACYRRRGGGGGGDCKG
ncbi:hypothetical protein Vretifemale_16093, partial [Volvox reticuliferus]